MNSAITSVRARSMPLKGDDIDTDRIIPARFLRCVTFDGLGENAFRDERFGEDGKPKGHPFDDPRYAGAGVLIVNRNFGCGSSREHAPQALARWGIKAIVGESFADIFSGNSAAIGLVLVTASAEDVARLQEAAAGAAEAVVDLVAMKASIGKVEAAVKMPEARRKNFVAGTWDTTASLLANASQAAAKAEAIPYLRKYA